MLAALITFGNTACYYIETKLLGTYQLLGTHTSSTIASMRVQKVYV